MNLVTGGTGLLGSHVLYELASNGESVRAIKRERSDLETVRKVFKHYSDNGDALFDEIEWVDGDVLDIFSLIDAMEGVTDVYHCAAFVSFWPQDAAKLEKINIEGTANVVNAALDVGIRKFCHVSSTAAIGRNMPGDHIVESNQWKNSKENSRYAISKYGAEREVWRGSEEGLQVVMVNPGIIIGPHDWNKSSSAVFKQIYKGLKFYADGGNGFVGVRDVARAMYQLTKSEINKQRFLLISENLTFREFFNYIAKGLNKPVPTKRISPFLLEIGWRVLKVLGWITGKRPAVTKETARALKGRYTYGNEKLIEALDFKYFSIEDACLNAGKYYLAQANS